MKYKIHIYDLINGTGEDNVRLEDIHRYIDRNRYRIMIYINSKYNDIVLEVFKKCNISYLATYYKNKNKRNEYIDKINKNVSKHNEYNTNIRDIMIFEMFDIYLSEKYAGKDLTTDRIQKDNVSLYSYGKEFDKNNEKFIVPTLIINKLTVIMNHLFFIVITKHTSSIYNQIDKQLFHVNGPSISTVFILKQLLLMQNLTNKKNIAIVGDVLKHFDKYVTNVTYGDVQELKLLIEILTSQLKLYQRFNVRNIAFYSELKNYNIIYHDKFFTKNIKDDNIYKLQSDINNQYVYDDGVLRPDIKLYTLEDRWKEYYQAEAETMKEDDLIVFNKPDIQNKSFYGLGNQLLDMNDRIIEEDDPCSCSHDTYCHGDICYRGCVDIDNSWHTPTCIVNDTDDRCRKGVASKWNLGRKWISCDIERYKKKLLIDLFMDSFINNNMEYLKSINDKMEEHKERLKEVKSSSFEQVEFYNSKNMSLLTIISTVFLPLSFLSGWYGMNFMNIPELYHKNSYFVLQAVVFILMAIGFWYYWEDIKNLAKDVRKKDD